MDTAAILNNNTKQKWGQMFALVPKSKPTPAKCTDTVLMWMHTDSLTRLNKEKLEGCEEIKPHSKSKLCLFRKNPVTSSIHSLKHFHEGRIAPTDFIWQSILRKKRKHEGEAEFNLYQL